MLILEHQVKNTEDLYRRVKTQCSGGSKISTFHPAASSLANYNGTISMISMTRLYCYVHVLPKRCFGFGMHNKCILPCSFGNKRMRLLTRAYGICIIGTSVNKPHTGELNCNFSYVIGASLSKAVLNGSGVCMYEFVCCIVNTFVFVE